MITAEQEEIYEGAKVSKQRAIAAIDVVRLQLWNYASHNIQVLCVVGTNFI